MYAVTTNAARRLCQRQFNSLQRIFSLSNASNHGRLRLPHQYTNVDYVAVRNRSSLPFNTGLVFVPQQEAQTEEKITSINHNQKFAIEELSKILDKLELTLNNFGNLKSADVVPALRILRNIISSENGIQLNTIPHFAEILLRSCGSSMIYESPETRENLAGQIWSCIKEADTQLNISHYNTLLKAFLDNNTHFDPSKILDEINSKGITPNRVTYQRLLHRYCLMGDISEAMKVLEHMKESNIEINESVFVSLITGYGIIKDIQSISQIFSLMRSNGLDPGAKTYVAHICALILNDGSEQTIRDILDEVNREEVSFTSSDYYEILNALVKKGEDNLLVDEILETLAASVQSFKNFNETLKNIISLVYQGYYKTASRIFWNMKHVNKEISRGRIGAFYLNAMVVSKQVPVDHIIQECSVLQEKGLHLKPYHNLVPIAALNGRADVLEGLIERISDAGNVKCHYYWPLIALADTKGTIDILKNKLKPVMNREELEYTFTEMVWPKLDQSATLEENVKQLLSLGYDQHLLLTSYLQFLIQTDRLSKLGDVSAVFNSSGLPTPRPGVESFVGMRSAIRSMNSLLEKEDVKGAVELYLVFANSFGVTPSSIELMERLLKEKNNQDLQKIIDACNKVQGESWTLSELAMACIRSGHIKQADKIFRSPNIRIRIERLEDCIDYFARRKWAFALENFLAATKSLYNLNRDKAYNALLVLYDQRNEAKKTLELCVQLQEDGYQMSKKSSLLAASILERNALEVPFPKPR